MTSLIGSGGNAYDDYLVIGRIVAPRGIRGELKVEIESQYPERFYDLTEVYLGPELVRFAVRRARLFKGQALLQLEGIEDRTTAETWRWAYVYVHIDDAIPLEEGEYFYHEIEGLTVFDERGQTLGIVEEVLATGANEVYVVRGPGGELLLPAIRDVILAIDLEAGTMVVRVPEGL